MSRLRYNNQSGNLAANPGISGTTITFQTAPDFATLTAPDYIVIALDEGQSTYEIVYLTAYTAGATTGTVQRAAEDATHWPAVAHPNGTWTCVPTVQDFIASGGGGTVSQVVSPGTTITVTNSTGPTVDVDLPSVGTAGTYGDATHIPQFTTDSNGRVSGVTSVPITGGGTVTNVTGDSTISVTSGTTTPALSRAALTGDITASAGSNATTLKNTGPGATGPIGSTTTIPSVTIDGQGRVTALTSNNGAFAQTANNLSDLANAGTARTNLGLGTAATQATGTFAQVANNLSDLASAATARTNLGLGTAATQASSFFAQTANNLSDLASAATARTNLNLPAGNGVAFLYARYAYR